MQIKNIFVKLTNILIKIFQKMDYIDKINQIIKDKGISQRKLAEMIGKPQGTIHNYLARKTKMDVDTLADIAKALGVDLGYLLGIQGLDEDIKSAVYEMINDQMKLEIVKTITGIVPDFFIKPKPFAQYDMKTKMALISVFSVLLELTTASCKDLEKLLKMDLLMKQLYFAICYARKYKKDIYELYYLYAQNLAKNQEKLMQAFLNNEDFMQLVKDFQDSGEKTKK